MPAGVERGRPVARRPPLLGVFQASARRCSSRRS